MWSNPVVGRRTSPFGPRPPLPRHGGFDIAPPTPGQQGVLVHAAGPGVVTAAGTGVLKGHTGLGVIVDHSQEPGAGPVRTYYGHLAGARVMVGQRVAAGDVIGVMGHSGNVSPPGPRGTHLHLGVLMKGALVDPDAFFAARGVRLGVDAPAAPAASGWVPVVPPELINDRLAAAGYTTAGRRSDYDRDAVRRYQSNQLWPDLVDDGLWGNATEGHYTWVVELQQALARLGGRLNIDGDFRAHTRKTLVNAQRGLGLTEDGVPGPRTCAALGIREHP